MVARSRHPHAVLSTCGTLKTSLACQLTIDVASAEGTDPMCIECPGCSKARRPLRAQLAGSHEGLLANSLPGSGVQGCSSTARPEGCQAVQPPVAALRHLTLLLPQGFMGSLSVHVCTPGSIVDTLWIGEAACGFSINAMLRGAGLVCWCHVFQNLIYPIASTRRAAQPRAAAGTGSAGAPDSWIHQAIIPLG